MVWRALLLVTLVGCGSPTPAPSSSAKPAPSQEASPPSPSGSSSVPPSASASSSSASPAEPEKGLHEGESKSFGDWEVVFVGRQGGLATLEGKFRGKSVGRWRPSEDRAHELTSKGGVVAFKVTTIAVHDTTIEIEGEPVDHATSAKLGTKLAMPGLYSFPGGLRVNARVITECDFDVSAPCPYGEKFWVHVMLGSEQLDAPLEGNVFFRGYTIVPGMRSMVVRK